MKYFYNSPNTKEKRRHLRKNQTDAERKLWSILRGKQFAGIKFFRQYSVGPYILDFYCPRQRITIEVDGSQHGEEVREQYDKNRTDYIRKQNIRVLRFWNNEVLNNIEGVWKKIREFIECS